MLCVSRGSEQVLVSDLGHQLLIGETASIAFWKLAKKKTTSVFHVIPMLLQQGLEAGMVAEWIRSGFPRKVA